MENQGADSLSRKGEVCFLSISIPQAEWWPTLQKEVLNDLFYTNLENRSDSHKFVRRDGV